MDRDRTRVFALGVVTLGLLAASLVVLDWFVFSLTAVGGSQLAEVGIDLQSIHACVGDGCASVTSATTSGVFPILCQATFIASCALGLVVAYQTIMRVTGAASPRLVRLGYLVGMLVLVLTVATAYVFRPELSTATGAELHGLELSIGRTWAPALSCLAALAGMSTMFYSVPHAVPEHQPIVAFPDVRARMSDPVRSNASTRDLAPGIIADARQRAVANPVAPAVPEVRERLRTPSGPIAPIDAKCKPSIQVPKLHLGRISYAVVTAELTRAGIDARREDASSLLVLWRDVVGVVVRRLPEDYAASAFVDIVSSAGSTLRLMPWSRLSGDALDTAGDVDLDSDARPRALVARVLEFAPDAVVDPATRTFVDGTDHPAQLPDLATLAAHDARLA